MNKKKVLIFATHPIQYQVPIYKALAKQVDLLVVYGLNQSPKGQAEAGFGVEFEWDIPLLEGYRYTFLKNYAKLPNSATFKGVVFDKKELKSLLIKEKASHVICNGWFPKGILQAAQVAKSIPGITVCTRGDSTLMMKSLWWKSHLKRAYLNLVFRNFHAFLYVGKENKAFYKHYGVKDNQLFKALHCVDTQFFEKQLNQYPKKSSSFFRLGFVGKFIDIKQPLLLIEALNACENKANMELHFVGDGPLKTVMLEKAAQYNLRVHFHGFLNQSELVEKGYGHMDALVLCSKSETWGLVVNEAMTLGIGAIVSDKVGCAADLIHDGSGLIFKHDQVQSLNEALSKAYNAHALERWGQGVKEAIAEYSLENTVKSYLRVIHG